jgi:hypothetical protein
LTLFRRSDPMGGRTGDRPSAETVRNTEVNDADEGGETMKQPTLISTAMHADLAGVARLRPAHGICAYPWHIGDAARATRPNAGTSVVDTESKLRFRWPGDPSS